MQFREQRTIRREVKLSGIGLFSGVDVNIRMLPAPPNHGIAFQRSDSPDSLPIPARIEFATFRQRRTALAREDVTVEMVEHTLAALAGLHIDNCLIEVDAAELPGFDGSCRQMVDALFAAEIESQGVPRKCLAIDRLIRVCDDEGDAEIVAKPFGLPLLAIGYHIDYGPRSPIPPSNLIVEMTPETFAAEIAFARTFVLESEVAALQAQGYGKRITAKDILVFGKSGVIDNTLRRDDECVRHKILDCLGDFALTGCDLQGFLYGYRSGHALNREVVRQLTMAHSATTSALDYSVA